MAKQHGPTSETEALQSLAGLGAATASGRPDASFLYIILLPFSNSNSSSYRDRHLKRINNFPLFSYLLRALESSSLVLVISFFISLPKYHYNALSRHHGCH